MPAPYELSMCALVDAIETGSFGPRAAIEESTTRIDVYGGRLNAFVGDAPEAPAESVVHTGRLRGVPVGLKDVFVVDGRPPTMGSHVHASGLSGTAEVVRRLLAAGAVVAGYTNLHEWAVGTTSIETATGPIRNPWNLEHVAGGSSGGSAAALAAGLVHAAVGTDLGGSIRVPSACCGVVGLKPTWGLVPTAGYAGDGGEIDHIGPMARTVEDVRALLEVMAPGDYAAPDVSDLVVGVPRAYFYDDVESETGSVVEAALGLIEPRVARVVAFDVPSVEMSRYAITGVAVPFLASLIGDSLFERGDELQPETRDVLMLGAQMPEEDQQRAAEARAAVRAGWDEVFETVDVVMTPTLPAPPALIAEKTVALPSGTASADLSYIALNAPMNLGGVPCLTLPCGETSEGWSVGVSITAARSRDGTALALGADLERVLDGAYSNRIAPVEDA